MIAPFARSWRRRRAPIDAPSPCLADGTPITLRPLRAEDGPLLVQSIARLSERARLLRFGTLTAHRNERFLRHLCAVDGRNHAAWVALRDAAVIGHAQWVRERNDSSTAELAVFVQDAFQRRGLGGALVRRAADDARRQGIERLAFYVLPANRSVLAMIRHWGASLTPEDGMVRGWIPTERLANPPSEPSHAELASPARACPDAHPGTARARLPRPALAARVTR